MTRRVFPFLAILAAALTPILAGARAAWGQVVTSAEAPREQAGGGWIGINLVATERHGPEGRIDSRLEIRSVVEGSPADRARLQPGDVILRVNGRPAHLDAFARLASRLRPGDRFELTLGREGPRWEGWERQVSVRAGARPASELVALPGEMVGRLDSAMQRLDSALVRITTHAQGWRPGVTVTLGDGVEPAPVVGTARLLARGTDSTRTFMLYSTRPEAAVWSPVIGRQVAGRALPDTPPTEPMIAGGRAFLEAPPTGPGPHGTLPDAVARAVEATTAIRPLMPYIAGQNRVAGAELTALNPGLAAYFQGIRGLLVTTVTEGTPARDAGLAPGDVVVGAGGAPVGSLAELRAALAHGRRILDVVRKGDTLRVTLPR